MVGQLQFHFVGRLTEACNILERTHETMDSFISLQFGPLLVHIATQQFPAKKAQNKTNNSSSIN